MPTPRPPVPPELPPDGEALIDEARPRAFRLLTARPQVMAVLAMLAVIGTACSSHSAATGSTPNSSTITTTSVSASPQSWNLVSLGDSLDRPSACPGCKGYVDLYARAIAKETGRRVNVHNDSDIMLSNVPAVDVSALLARILTDDSVRRDIANADIVVISIGYNDTPWNRLDDPCDAAPRYPTVHWSALSAGCIYRVTSDYKHTLDQA